MSSPEMENLQPNGWAWDGAMLLQFLAGKLRIRVESGRKRLDLEKVIHLELLMPNEYGDSKWTPISTTSFDEDR